MAQPIASKGDAAQAAQSSGGAIRPLSRPSMAPNATAGEADAKAGAEADFAWLHGAGSEVNRAPRPKARPVALAASSRHSPNESPRNWSRNAPSDTQQKPEKKQSGSMKGSVCGVAAIKGEKIAPIRSKNPGCGLEDGVRVTSVSGVRLSMAITVDCQTAKALNTWVERAAQPAYGGKIVELKMAGHYVCRPRNHKKGAKVSEHGRGRAVDVSGFKLANGQTLPVLHGFDKRMRQAHKGACGIFGTTLGPGSDGYHEDHLHFDTARHRSGSYCR